MGDKLRSSVANSELMAFRRLRGASTESLNRSAVWRPGSNSERTGSDTGSADWRSLLGSANWRPPVSRFAAGGPLQRGSRHW